MANNTRRGRFSASYADGRRWGLKTQADVVRTFYLRPCTGWMLSQHLRYTRRSLQASAVAAWFHTDDYQSRLFLSEPQLAHTLSFPSYYGHGLRLAFTARAGVGRHLQLTARVGFTSYFNRSTIGSGLQLIDHSSMTDVALQLRYKW